MFSCKFCKISFFKEHLCVTASVSVFHPAFFLPIKKAQKQPPEVLYEKTILKILQYSQLCITLLLESLFNKVTGLQAFMWNLQNFSEHLFLQNTSGGCLWRQQTFVWQFVTLNSKGVSKKSNLNGTNVEKLRKLHTFVIQKKKKEKCIETLKNYIHSHILNFWRS